MSVVIAQRPTVHGLNPKLLNCTTAPTAPTRKRYELIRRYIEVMEVQGGGQYQQSHSGEPKSPERSKAKLQLPVSCDPPGPANPPKQLVWIVSYYPIHLPLVSRYEMLFH